MSVINMFDSGFGFSLTENACDKISSLQAERKNAVVLRLSIVGGGCSGFQYVFLLEPIACEEKEINENEDVDFLNNSFDSNEDFKGEELDVLEKELCDHVVEDNIKLLNSNGDVFFVTDSSSLKFLSESVIDYSEDLIGSGFVVNNPKAKSKCGCGSSFSI